MSELSPQLALRIGLAARALPNVTPACFVRILLDAVRMPLTDQKLKALSARQLRMAGRGALRSVPGANLDRALQYLWDRAGVDIEDPAIPRPQPYRDGDLPGSVRVAVASDQGLALDGDFGTCARFLVFQVSPTASRLIAVRGTAGGNGADDRSAWRADLIRDCRILFVARIGIRGHAKLVKHGTFVVPDPAGGSAWTAVEGLARVLRDGPPPWIGKLTARRALNPALPRALLNADLNPAATAAIGR